MKIALINTNRIKPPIAPIGLDYTAEALIAAGHDVRLLDLCWADDIRPAVTGFFKEADFDLAGISFRNTDDCVFTSRKSFFGELTTVVDTIRENTSAFIVLGGVGFSTMPEELLSRCAADAGIWGDGESALIDLAGRLQKGIEWRDLPNLVRRHDGGCLCNPPIMSPLEQLPAMTRSWIDNRRYFLEGGQAGVETKRGCPNRCIYCADPAAKGRKVRARPPEAVADEFGNLLRQGIDHIHTCDSEFNLPLEHAVAVCRELIDRGLGNKVRWYAYCSPIPFTTELASLMRRAGCAGINFGVDNGDELMLRRLGRDFSPDDIINAARLSREAGMSVMLDLLLGSPGESENSLKKTVDLVRMALPDRAGVAVGVRIYPKTELHAMLVKGELNDGLSGGGSPMDPLFFLEPEVSGFIFELLDKLIGDDETFFFFDPSKPERNYNYNANQLLTEAIRKGYRGAYWDILRRT